MSQRDQIVQAIRKAGTLQEQAALVSQLDDFDRQQRQASSDARSIDMSDTIVRQTLQPVAVHERSTIETDWLGDFTASSDYSTTITAQAALWFGRTSAEVRADQDEFMEQARGMARRQASIYGGEAADAERHFLDYVAFLRTQAASGLPQVQQLVDSQENPAQTELPQEPFDNFAPPVHPINEGVSGTETSERAPLLQEIENGGSNGQGQQAPTHHDEHPVPYTYAEVPPQAPQQMTGARKQADRSCGCPDDYHLADCPIKTGGGSRDEDPEDFYDDWRHHGSFFNPSLALGHVATLDDFRPGGQFHQAAENNADFTDSTSHATTPYGQHPYSQGEDASGSVADDDALKAPSANDVAKEAASGLPQVEQVVDSFENPDRKPLPEEVAFPWQLDENDDIDERSDKKAAVQRRAAYVAGLLQQDPASLSEVQRREIKSFTASLTKRADQWTQGEPQYHGPGSANTPETTPERTDGSYQEGYAEGRSDWLGDQAPTFADDSSHAPDFVRGHSEGYGDAARTEPNTQPGQLPPGAGNHEYLTHAASRKQAVGEVECSNCGKSLKPWQAVSRGGTDGAGNFKQTHWCTDCKPPARPDDAPQQVSGSLKVSAAFTAPIEAEHKDFVKGYRYAQRWTPGTALVTTGSAEFEAGLYAGITDNPAMQSPWTEAHRRTAKAYRKPELMRRMALHRSFTQKVAAQGRRVEGNYVQAEVNKTAATSTDLDTMGPGSSPLPSGQTPINGPGEVPPLAGQTDAAAPGGPAPYNAAPPYGSPVVPSGGAPHGVPSAVDGTLGGPVDQAAMQHLSPQTMAFRKTVQANLLNQRK